MSAVLLVALSPALACIGAAVVVLSGASPLVAHRRIGWRGEPFWMLKFRTMWNGPREPGALVAFLREPPVPGRKTADDPRVVHPFARWMRRYSIDELPQLLHVVAGRMALAGPRPLTEDELSEHYGESMVEVLQVKPGITGLWQVMGRNRLTYRQRRRLDVFFVRRRSLRLYLSILWRTVPAVLRGENAG